MTILLRALSGMFGAFILFLVTPWVILWGQITSFQREVPDTFWDYAFVGAFFALFASGFLLVALFGNRIIQTVRLKVVTALLLAVPFVVTSAPLVIGGHPEVVPVLLPILLFTVLLLSAFVWPKWLKVNNGQG